MGRGAGRQGSMGSGGRQAGGVVKEGCEAGGERGGEGDEGLFIILYTLFFLLLRSYILYVLLQHC